MIAAEAAHVPAMAAIHAACFAAGEAWPAASLAVLLATPGCMGLIDPRGGFVVLRQAADEADVVTIAVLPGCRRRGLGRALLEAGLERLTTRGVRRVFLEVSEANVAAAALYCGCGFVQVGRRGDYYPGGEAALLLCRATH